MTRGGKKKNNQKKKQTIVPRKKFLPDSTDADQISFSMNELSMFDWSFMVFLFPSFLCS